MAAAPALWLYALTAADPGALAGVAGVAGEPLRAVPLGDAPGALHAVVGAVADPPRPGEPALRAHDAVVRAVAAVVDAVLPVRFGQWLAGEEQLAALLAPRLGELGAALGRVAGCHQITLRLLGAPGATEGGVAPAGAPPEPAGPGPGARYLDERRRRLAPPPEILPVLALLAPHVRAERLAGAPPPYRASAYHLVGRADTGAYLAALAAATAAPGAPALTWSGPWPPWAFAPELAP